MVISGIENNKFYIMKLKLIEVDRKHFQKRTIRLYSNHKLTNIKIIMIDFLLKPMSSLI